MTPNQISVHTFNGYKMGCQEKMEGFGRMKNAYIHYWLWKIQGSGLALFSGHLFGSETGLHRSGDLFRGHGSHMGQSIISRSKIEGFETDGPEVSQGA